MKTEPLLLNMKVQQEIQLRNLINIEGIPLKLIDTAGIRNAKDEVEKIGIAKSREIAKRGRFNYSNI